MILILRLSLRGLIAAQSAAEHYDASSLAFAKSNACSSFPISDAAASRDGFLRRWNPGRANCGKHPCCLRQASDSLRRSGFTNLPGIMRLQVSVNTPAVRSVYVSRSDYVE